MKKVLVIDNYDSFTYNLVHILREFGTECEVQIVRNDAFEMDEVDAYDYILLSPGPGVPKDAGLMPKVIDRYAPTKNILGVCLGHQAIGESFGAKLFNLPKVFHGMVTPIEITQDDLLYQGLPSSFNVCRYHSWVIEKGSLPDSLEVTSVAENGNVMSVKHKEYAVRGVQYHPESIMTEHGKLLMKNWLEL